MTKRTFRLTQGLDKALRQQAKAQGVATSVIVRDALAAYFFLTSATSDVSRQLTLLSEQQRLAAERIEALLERRVPGAVAPLIPSGPSNPILQRLQRQLKDENNDGT